jgi:hypothetical protein
LDHLESSPHAERDTEELAAQSLEAHKASSDHEAGPANAIANAYDGVITRGKKMFEWRSLHDSLLDIALDHLTLARPALYNSILVGGVPTGEHVGEALSFARGAGQEDHLPRTLMMHALWSALTEGFEGACEDLDEAFEIAERGPMRLYMADIHLHRARLFGLTVNRPASYPWVSARDDLDKAGRLIHECGYGRRREELEDAEAAWQRLYRTAAPGGVN